MHIQQMKSEFDSAMATFLSTIETLQSDDIAAQEDAWFSVDCGVGSSLLITESSWLNLLKKVDDIFGSTVRERIVSVAVPSKIRELYDAGGFPFDEDELRVTSGKVFSELHAYSQQETEFLSPINHLKFDRSQSYTVSLANAVLYTASPDSLLVKAAKRATNENSDVDWSRHGFLHLLVSGDGDTRRLRALSEAENALKVLRFVGEWRSKVSNNRIEWNNNVLPATILRDASKLFYGIADGNIAGKVRAHVPSSSPVTLTETFFTNARQYYGLEDINHHYKNIGNRISEQVIRALTLYDSGIRASTDWEAMYQYVSSINVAVLTGTGNSSKLSKDVRTLIHFGNGFLSTKREGSDQSRTVKFNWNDLVKEKVNPFADFYQLRSQIVHGSEMNYGRITHEVLKDARELAHNAVRIVAYLARQNGWSDYDTVKNWFEAKRRKWEAEEATIQK